jgi:outer membrane protein TolC
MDYTFVGQPTVPAMGEIPGGQDAVMLPMLTVKVPLYRQKYKGQREEAAFKQKATLQQKENTQNELKADFEKYYRQYRTATREIKFYEQQIQKAQQALDVLSNDYSRGGEGFEEVLRMERKLLDYKLQQQHAFAQQHLAVARIHYLIGK